MRQHLVRLIYVVPQSEPGYDITADKFGKGNRNRVMINGVQSKMARMATGLGVREIAKGAGVSTDTVARLERGELLRDSTNLAIQRAYEAGGAIFIDENGEGPGVRLRKDRANVNEITLDQLTAEHLVAWRAIDAIDEAGYRKRIWDSRRLVPVASASAEVPVSQYGFIRVSSLRDDLEAAYAKITALDTLGNKRLVR